jgi:hypothetical protein
MSKQDHTLDPENQRGAISPAPSGGALVSLQALEAAFRSVDTSSMAGRSGLPMLLFKREGSGTYTFGQKQTVVEDGSRWAVNPATFKWGYICFGTDNKVFERLVPVTQPMPNITELPDTGFPWQPEMTVNMKCSSGTDAGLEVVFKTAADGGIKGVTGLIDAVRDRLNGGQHGGKVVPIVRLEKDSYQHRDYGRIWFPVFEIVEWVTLDGPEAAPSPPPPQPAPASTKGPTAGGSSAAEQPRRRRFA